MDQVKELTRSAVLMSLVVLLVTSSMTKAMPNKRSSAREMLLNQHGHSDIHLSDTIMRDFMMHTADKNGDHKLSSHEIAWFYRNMVQYTDYVSEVYGNSFIHIADMDHDGLLDEDELLQMIVAMDAYEWTKRR